MEKHKARCILLNTGWSGGAYGTGKRISIKDTRALLNAALRGALKDPEFIKRQEALGAVVVTDARINPVDHKKFVEAEINKWGPAIKAAGQYAD